MCGLCGPDKHEQARRDREVAEALEALARDYRAMADGTLDPHPANAGTPESPLATTESRVRFAIVNLARDWL